MFFPPHEDILSYCLTCGGTGCRGGKLSGKKKCKTCKGTGTRELKAEPIHGTTFDFVSVTIPAIKQPFPKIDARDIVGPNEPQTD